MPIIHAAPAAKIPPTSHENITGSPNPPRYPSPAGLIFSIIAILLLSPGVGVEFYDKVWSFPGNLLSDDFIVKEKKFYNKFINKMNLYDNSKLSNDELLSKNVLLWECKMNLERLQFPKDLMPVDQMWSFQLSMGQLASGMGAQPFKSFKDYTNWLVRIDG